jgi:hypothetical protein
MVWGMDELVNALMFLAIFPGLPLLIGWIGCKIQGSDDDRIFKY